MVSTRRALPCSSGQHRIIQQHGAAFDQGVAVALGRGALVWPGRVGVRASAVERIQHGPHYRGGLVVQVPVPSAATRRHSGVVQLPRWGWRRLGGWRPVGIQVRQHPVSDLCQRPGFEPAGMPGQGLLDLGLGCTPAGMRRIASVTIRTAAELISPAAINATAAAIRATMPYPDRPATPTASRSPMICNTRACAIRDSIRGTQPSQPLGMHLIDHRCRHDTYCRNQHRQFRMPKMTQNNN